MSVPPFVVVAVPKVQVPSLVTRWSTLSLDNTVVPSGEIPVGVGAGAGAGAGAGVGVGVGFVVVTQCPPTHSYQPYLLVRAYICPPFATSSSTAAPVAACFPLSRMTSPPF